MDCDRPVSSGAKTCPACGSPTAETRAMTTQRQWVLVPVLVVVLGALLVFLVTILGNALAG